MNRTLPPGVTLDMLHDISALTSREARYDFGHGEALSLLENELTFENSDFLI
jgi:hypothetical protein